LPAPAILGREAAALAGGERSDGMEDVQVRTHVQGGGGAGRGAAAEGDAAFSWAPVILP